MKTPERKPLLIVVVVLVLIVGGFVLVNHSREARAKFNPDAMLNEINNKGANLRHQLREAQSRAAMTAGAINNQLPADLDEA